MSRYLYIVDVFGEFVRCSFCFAVRCCKANFIDRVAVEFGFVFIDYRVVVVDSYCLIVVRDREGKDLLVKLFFAFYKLKEFNITS